MPRHRHQALLAFLRRIEKSVPAKLDIHLIVDNYSTHKHARVKAWLARHPRWHIHFIPTYSSWLNQVEPSGTSPRKPSAAAPSAASKSWWPRSITS
jgi:transposase